MKRYQEGGEAEGISGTADKMTTTKDVKPRTTDDMSFGKAFNYYRKKGEKTFMWRGQKYTTETKEEQDRKKTDKDRERAEKELKEVEVIGKRRMSAEDFMKSSDQTVGVETGAKRSQPSMVDFKTEGRRKSEPKKETDVGGRRRFMAPGARREREKARSEATSYRKGGSIDGCAKRGHTRGTII
jgi:hypothetical protein